MILEFKTREERPDEKPLNVTVSDPVNEILYWKKNINAAKFSLTTLTNGDHTFCVENMGSVKVDISAIIKVGTDAKDYNAMASTLDLKPVELKINKISDTAESINKELQYLREREEQMRNTNLTIHNRVIGYSTCTLVFLLFLTVIQLVYLKRFFKAKKLI